MKYLQVIIDNHYGGYMKVSVIVPVYNSESYLKDCLDSLVNQTLKEIEIIAVDDASTDKSLEILLEYAKKYPGKIKVFASKQNKGQGAARNIGLSISTGEYIGFLDSDDYVSPTMYEKLYNAAKFNSADIASTRLTFVKDNSYLGKKFETYGREENYNPINTPEKVLDESPSVCNKIFKKEFLKDQTFLEDCMWEDVAFTYANLFNAKNIVNINNMGYYYRKSATSGVSAKGFKFNPHLLDTFRVADRLEYDTKKSGRFDILKENIRYMQIVTTLQRVAEVLSWDIPEEKKEALVYAMNDLITWKYGNWQNLDLASLSMRVGILELDKIKEMVAKYKEKILKMRKEERDLDVPYIHLDEPKNFPPNR